MVIASMLDFLTFAICAPYSETTSGSTFDTILELVAARGHSFYHLFQYPSMTIVKGAGLVMRAIIEESTIDISRQMQMLSLTEGAFLKHLHMALLSTGRDLRVLANKQLSGHLISLWITENSAALNLLSRCLPRGLLDYLDSAEKPHIAENDLLLMRNNLKVATSESKQGVFTEQMQSMQITLEAKFDQFLQHWNLDQKLSFFQKRDVADLIWNEKTREDFRRCIETELRMLEQEKELSSSGTSIAWNYTDFEICYTSLAEEVKIGDYYLRLLLQETETNATSIHNSPEFFNNVYHRFLLSAKSEMRCLCLRAMAFTYGRHYLTIGPFQDSKYIVNMLAKCANAGERDHLILLISKLVLNKENVRDLLSAGILPILVDFAVLSHLCINRATVPNKMQNNLIEGDSSNKDHESLEWYYADKAGSRHGPFSFGEMKKFYGDKTVFERTQIWAQGLDHWTSLSSVPQFRWTVCSQANTDILYNFTELCIGILDILIQMCMYYPSRDENNCVIRPLPQVKRILCEPTLLYQIVQLLLTYDPGIVQRIASLLLHIMEDNPFLSRLYLSGVFFFILMYNGSNVLPIARFLHYTHMKQAFRSTVAKSEFVSHSVLSPLLPEAAILYLEEYGAEKYAQMFLAEFDNPEIIWNADMRTHLIERIALHVCDFSSRLTSNIKAIYQYCPIPVVDYAQLDGELFCHVYYLRHLCNMKKFPDWPIRDPVIFLQSCLAAWLDEIEKKPPSMSLEQAFEILELVYDEETLKSKSTIRRAYFKLAQKYHPDKNSQGREIFERINGAYELLTSNVKLRGSLPDIDRIILCIQAQSIVYRRYCKELSPFKYAGYVQLIRTIELESKDDFLFASGGGNLLCAAVELCKYTLISSALNSEQLRRDGGLEILINALDRCAPMVNISSEENDMPAKVCAHILHCFETAARFESCREKISELPTVFSNICRLLQFNKCIRVACAAADCVCSFSVCTLLQMQLFQAGVIWQLLPHLFRYDYTLDEGGVKHSEENNLQSLCNKLARRCCEALACLAGFRESTPENDGVHNSLRAMLTPFICHSMKHCDNDFVLKLLNSNTRNPYLLWDGATRSEVLEFVELHRTSNEKVSELFGAEFKMSVYAKELIIGNIFVKIYNEQPDFKLYEPKQFCIDILQFLDVNSKKLINNEDHESINTNSSVDFANKSDSKTDVMSLVDEALKALINLLMFNIGSFLKFIEQYSMDLIFFMFVPEIIVDEALLFLFCRSGNIISLSANNRDCVSDIATSSQSPILFGLIIENPKTIPMVLKTAIALSSNGKIVKQMLEFGDLLYILIIFFDSQLEMESRIASAELLAKLQCDKLSGPRWNRFITRYLPPIFADALRDSPCAAVTMFDSNHENPELIWNDVVRETLKTAVLNSCKKLYAVQQPEYSTKWDEKADNTYVCDIGNAEIVVAGVFLRLFIANPSWQVRHPKQFATELMEHVLEQLKQPTSALDLVTSAFIAFLRNHPIVADQLPAQGYLPQFCSVMKSTNAVTSYPAIIIFSLLAENEYCADSFAKLNCIDGLLNSMKYQPTLIFESAHALKCLAKRNCGELAGQILSSEIINYLLDLLRGKMTGVTNPAAAKAEIVDALKALCLDLQFGEEIQAALNKSSIWSQYKDQRHDLFLPAPQVQAIGS
ncbi:unnamed protein product [Dracunculus medinensis]|uniref:J domain-containing protein n=1 Tax=Dracunculus medinensis TaxID=318479 RepID=A0A3P7SF78_DRAME|nr:unnamed protein product [Dracunculus medinensis]